MTIAEVSKYYELSIDTLRYYERAGLIPPVRRGKGGMRDYSDKDIEWVGFIKCMRIANIPIEVLVKYVNLFKEGKSTQEDRKSLLKEQRDQLAEQIAKLQKILKKLDYKIANYGTVVLSAEKKLVW
ncbi:MAG: MerR family transcriptional regulator [Planctomycetota bacterium]|jgi:DNA-binding transcriptional MerR regulator|nr:MerR family transcriptional regulator [Planctomycetota bacterium]